MRTLKFKFLVTIEVEDTSNLIDQNDEAYGYFPTSTDARDYVRAAVQSHGGQRHLHDPFFRPKRVTVQSKGCMPNRVRSTHTSMGKP